MVKTFVKIGMAVMIALAFVGCRSNKGVVLKNNIDKGTKTEFSLNIPCLNESYDDEQYFRALGTGTSSSMDNVRMLAFQDARTKLMMKIAETVEVGEDVEIDVICEKITIDMNGLYHGYVVLQVAKDFITGKTLNK